MSEVSSPYHSPAYDPVSDPRRWMFAGLALMFVLIGVAAVLSIVTSDNLPWFHAPSMMGSGWTWGWLGGALLLLVFVWIAFAMVRALAWGFDGNYLERHWARHYGRWGYDPAMAVARERFARGEISREQFDQLATDLGRGGPGRFP